MTPAIVLPMPTDNEEALAPTDVIDSSLRPLSTRHLAFIDAYLGPASFNAAEAARLAGYIDTGTGSIRVQGHRVLMRDNVQREIRQRINAARLTREYVIDGLMRAHSGALEDKAYGSAVAAARELGRILALFVDRTELDIRAAIAQVSAEQGLDPDELEAEVKRLAADSS